MYQCSKPCCWKKRGLQWDSMKRQGKNKNNPQGKNILWNPLESISIKLKAF